MLPPLTGFPSVSTTPVTSADGAEQPVRMQVQNTQKNRWRYVTGDDSQKMNAMSEKRLPLNAHFFFAIPRTNGLIDHTIHTLRKGLDTSIYKKKVCDSRMLASKTII